MPMTDIEFMRSYFSAFHTFYYPIELDWNPDYARNDERAFMTALSLYTSLTAPPSTRLVIGDSKIRTDPDLLARYGMATNLSVNPEDRKLITKRAATLGITLDWQKLVATTGAILTNANWNSALNDTFILSGVHSGAIFLFEDESASPANIAGRQLGARNAEGQNVGLVGRSQWRSFFNHNPQILWQTMTGKPRILVRELLGLYKFGYRPAFTETTLTFVPGDANARAPTVANYESYTKCLEDGGYSANDKRKVLPVLAKYLFDDENGLTVSLFGPEGQDVRSNAAMENIMTLRNQAVASSVH